MEINLKKMPFLLCAAVVLLLGACQLDKVEKFDGGKFWVADFSKANQPVYSINATKLFEGQECIIYTGNGSGVTKIDAERYAKKFDNSIYDMMVRYFCQENITENSVTYANTLKYSYSLVKNQDKLIILMMDIKDTYTGNKGDGYVAGYFDPTDFYELSNSNYKSMIYVDTDPGLRDEEKMFETFIHELQHLINYVTSMRVRPNNSSRIPNRMDTWIDEGLSAMAEYLYRTDSFSRPGMPDKDRIAWFNEDPKKTISQGNNFFIWDNYQSVDNAILDEYATVHMFFYWLFFQANEDAALLKKIISSGKSNYQALTENTAAVISGGGDWETLLRTWMAANYLNAGNGAYGYKNKPEFSNIKVKAIKTENDKILLYPGEGVYSVMNSEFAASQDDSGENIRYAGLKKPNTVNASAPLYSGDFLLTFNKNTTGKIQENGYLTGEEPPSETPIKAAVGGRFVSDNSSPMIIDAQDLMRKRRGDTLILPEAYEALRTAHEN